MEHGVPDPGLRTLPAWCYLIFTSPLWCRYDYYYYLYFTKKIEAQRSQLNCPRLYVWYLTPEPFLLTRVFYCYFNLQVLNLRWNIFFKYLLVYVLYSLFWKSSIWLAQLPPQIVVFAILICKYSLYTKNICFFLFCCTFCLGFSPRVLFCFIHFDVQTFKKF